MECKKICFITTVPLTLKVFVLENAKYLHDKGNYNITFICDEDADFEKELPEYISYIPVKMSRGISLNGIKAIFRLNSIFRKEKFDYVQYSTPNASFYSSVAAFLSNVPVRLYAQWGIRYVGEIGFARTILKTLEKITCKLSTHVRAVSNMNMDFSICEGLYKNDKVKVIGNGGTIGVDLNEFDISKKHMMALEMKEEYAIPDECFVFGFIGRMNKDKGSNELLSAFRMLVNKGYSTVLFIVGNLENCEGIDKDLLEWGRNSKNVIFTGAFPKSELIKFYSVFDCYVHPTYREGFGMVLQEAGAMGNAIITTNIPGASEVMEDGVSCELVEARNSNELANAMEKLLLDPIKTRKLGAAAFERTKKFYERSIMLDNIHRDLDMILGE